MADTTSMYSGHNSLRRQRDRERGSLRGHNPTNNRIVSASASTPRNDDRYDTASLSAYDASSLRVPRTSEALYEQHPIRSLRSTSSRFSLNEHFSATRSVYDFGFDDASSYMPDGASVILHDGDEDEEGDETIKDAGLTQQEVEEAVEELEGDYYDVLNLPRYASEREQGGLTVDEVRAAYYRMFFMFYPGSFPEGMQSIATRIFLKAQEGFEVLVDGNRRARYDADLTGRTTGSTGRTEVLEYTTAARDQIWRRLQEESGMASDLGVRFDMSSLAQPTTSRGWRPLDFNIGHSTTRPLPTGLSERISARMPTLGFPSGVITTTPTFTLSGSVYGIMPPMSQAPPYALASPHQPLNPATSPQHRLLQLTETKLSPVISAAFRHELCAQEPQTGPNRGVQWLRSELEYGVDVFPDVAPSVRSYHHVSLSRSHDPTIVEVSLKGRSWSDEVPPRVALGVHQKVPFGTAFARVDSGDWTLDPEAFRFLSGGARSSQSVAYADFPLQVALALEVGITTADSRASTSSTTAWLDQQAGATPMSLTRESQPRRAPKAGSWTASTTVLPLSNISSAVRYTAQVPHSTSQIEIEFSCSTIYPHQVSARHLFPITTSSSLGLELAVSRQATHVSLYFSRLSQKLSIPLLLPSASNFKTTTLFYAAVVPLLAVAAYKFWKRSTKQRGLRSILKRKTKPKRDVASPAMQAAIAIRREEADHLTGLLAQPVGARQKHHAAQNGLVILSAKLGVPDDSMAQEAMPVNSQKSLPAIALGGVMTTFDPDVEAADVTVALAALVSHQTGTLTIPRGVRKGRIPGFWDPAPDREKVLLVRYSWMGIESIAEVRAEEELVLPPMR